MNIVSGAAPAHLLERLLLSRLMLAGVSSDVSLGMVHCLMADGIDPDILAELNNLEIVIDEDDQNAAPDDGSSSGANALDAASPN